MLLIGLTGSIATGKSTVSRLLSEPPHSLPVVDADVLARQVVEPGKAAYRAIVAHFGPTTPDLLVPPDGDAMPEQGPAGKGRPINRPALGRLVFGDGAQQKANRAVLNSFVHPAVRWAMGRAVLWAWLAGRGAVVLDVPLLFESQLDALCGTVLVVAVSDPATQMARLRARDPHLSADDAANRVRSQVDVRDKARRCEARGHGRGLVVWNDDGQDELRARVDAAMREIRRASPAWWNRLLWICPPLGLAVAAWTYLQNLRINREWEKMQPRERPNL